MKRKPEPTLHIEWSRDGVVGIDTATGRTAVAPNVADLVGIFVGYRDVLVGVGRGEVFLKSVRLPRAEPDDLRRIVEIRLGQLFPLAPELLAFDCVQAEERNVEGFLTVIAAVRTDDLRRLGEELRQAGLSASRILPVALGAWALARRSGLAGALVMERSAAGLSLDVVLDGALRLSRVVPRDADPVLEAARTLAAAHCDHVPIVCVGGLAIPNALPVECSSLQALADAPEFRLERAEDREARAVRHVASMMRRSLLFFTAACLVSGLTLADRHVKAVAAQRGEAEWKRELGQLQAQLRSNDTRTRELQDMRAELARVFEPGQAISDVAAVVSDHLPSTAWLTGLTVERGKSVQLRGTAMEAGDVARFVNAISASTRFRDVKLVFANSARIEEKNVVQFNVSAVAVGNVPMPEAEKRSAKSHSSAGSRSDFGETRETL